MMLASGSFLVIASVMNPARSEWPEKSRWLLLPSMVGVAVMPAVLVRRLMMSVKVR